MVEPRAQVLLEAAVYRPIKRLPPERLRPVILAGRSFRLVVTTGIISATSFLMIFGGVIKQCISIQTLQAGT
jgi:hypothetical protein